MEDNDDKFAIDAQDVCLDLVSIPDKYTKFIPSLLSLPQGRWHDLRQVIHQAGLTSAKDALIEGAVVGWLDDPVLSPSWVTVIFLHFERSWDNLAHFNREALPLPEQK